MASRRCFGRSVGGLTSSSTTATGAQMCAGTTSGGDRRGRDRLCATQQRLRMSAHGRLLFNAVSRRRSRLGAANYAIRWQVEADGRGSYARCAVAIDVDVSSVLELIADAVRRQQCILFLGAGVHAPPPEGSPFEYPPRSGRRSVRRLSRELAATCGLGERFPNEDPANLQTGRAVLRDRALAPSARRCHQERGTGRQAAIADAPGAGRAWTSRW